jgi:hypothetical protein
MTMKLPLVKLRRVRFPAGSVVRAEELVGEHCFPKVVFEQLLPSLRHLAVGKELIHTVITPFVPIAESNQWAAALQ